MRILIMNDVVRSILGPFLCVGIFLNVAAPAAARTPFDGLWSVSIVTEQGTCDRGYRYPLAIVNGDVRHAPNEGDSSFVIAGHVGTGGAVKVSVRRGDQLAEASGRLSSSGGKGRWRSPSDGCAGYWTAERRG